MNHNDAINALINPDSIHAIALRSLMIELFAHERHFDDAIESAAADAIEYDYELPSTLRTMTLAALILDDAMRHNRDALTQLALDDSLCPMHFVDYAICFDDDNDECAAIRLIHPSHDT